MKPDAQPIVATFTNRTGKRLTVHYMSATSDGWCAAVELEDGTAAILPCDMSKRDFPHPLLPLHLDLSEE